jgi:hypothetical protein
MRYLKAWELSDGNSETRQLITLDKDMMKANIFCKYQDEARFHMVPVCFALISKQGFEIYEPESIDSKIADYTEKIFSAIEAVDLLNSDGKNFEDFTWNALLIRVLIRISQNSPMTVSSFFPGDAYTLTTPCEWSRGQRSIIHVISSKKELLRFLLPPMYFIFPLHLKRLEKSSNDKSHLDTLLATLFSENRLLRFEKPQTPMNVSTDIFKENVSFVINSGRTLSADVIKFFYNEILDSVKYEFQPIKALQKSWDSAAQKLCNQFPEMLHDDDFKNWKDGMFAQLKKLITAVDKKVTFVPCVKGAEGLEMVVMWTTKDGSDEDSDGHQSDDKCTRTVNIAAIELKDRRDTTVDEWKRKLASLHSHRCIIWWFQPIVSSTWIVNFHLVLGGREEIDRNFHIPTPFVDPTMNE